MVRTLVALIVITAAFDIADPAANALTKGEIDAGVSAALTRFRKEVKGGAEYLKASKGVLVRPHVTKAGFIVGGQYGQGALQAEGKSSTTASFRVPGTRSAHTLRKTISGERTALHPMRRKR
jgi:lipid-binding SYLF domain-containing protein